MHFKHTRRRVLKIKPSVVVNLNLDDNDDNNHRKSITLIVKVSGLTNSIKKADYIEEKRISEK